MIKINSNVFNNSAVYGFTCVRWGTTVALIPMFVYEYCVTCDEKEKCVVSKFETSLDDKDLVTLCKRCNALLDIGYMMILYALKTKGFLPDKHPSLCCSCYNTMKRDLDANNKDI